MSSIDPAHYVQGHWTHKLIYHLSYAQQSAFHTGHRGAYPGAGELWQTPIHFSTLPLKLENKIFFLKSFPWKFLDTHGV